MTTMSATVTAEGFTLARFIWATFRRQPDGLLEAALAANPGIAEQTVLPVGTIVVFPLEAVAAQQTPAREVIRLWD